MARSGFALVATLLISAPTIALAALPDRSTLSYEENVTVNTACAGALKRGDGPFNDCVSRQLSQLESHPSPDRSVLSAEKNQAIETKCSYYRRLSIGEYNDCLKKAMEATTEPEQAANDIGDLESRPNYGQLFTQGKTETPKVETPAVTPVADTSLALPPSVLPKRPDHLSKQAMEPKEVFKRVKDSIFIVLAAPTMADAKQRNIALGSAVAISDHLLLTNCHVVKDRPVIKIVQNGKVTDAKLIAGRMSLDRCVLEVKDIELKAVAAIRSFDDLEKGERVVAIGTPNGNEQTLSEGLVSGLQARPGANIVQTTAPVSPGSSGGGLFDERGNLIGITFMQSLGRVQNLNSALAASDYWN